MAGPDDFVKAEDSPFVLYAGGEHRGTRAVGPVFSFQPGCALVSMPPFHPLPQTVPDACVNITECLAGYNMPVIIGPAPDFGVELTDHAYGAHTGVLSDGFPDISQE